MSFSGMSIENALAKSWKSRSGLFSKSKKEVADFGSLIFNLLYIFSSSGLRNNFDSLSFSSIILFFFSENILYLPSDTRPDL